MKRLSDQILTEFGGIKALADLVEAPFSTVKSWRTSRITDSRLNHLRLAAMTKGMVISWDTLEDAGAPEEAKAA